VSSTEMRRAQAFPGSGESLSLALRGSSAYNVAVIVGAPTCAQLDPGPCAGCIPCLILKLIVVLRGAKRKFRMPLAAYGREHALCVNGLTKTLDAWPAYSRLCFMLCI